MVNSGWWTADTNQKSRCKMQNDNARIKMVQQLVILSETKNLGCDAVSSMLWPDPSAAPQDDRKTAYSGAKSDETERNIRINLKKQSVRQAKLVQFSRYESCPAKVSRPAGM